jgi:hypothetical protein
MSVYVISYFDSVNVLLRDKIDNHNKSVPTWDSLRYYVRLWTT